MAARSMHILSQALNCLIGLLLIAGVIIVESIIKPNKRGFYCYDSTINKPYKSQTVPTQFLAVMLIVGVIMIVLIEIVNYSRSSGKHKVCPDDNNKVQVFGLISLRNCILRCFNRVGFFLIGCAFVLCVTGLGKLMVGRLRPHFLTVCRPDYTKINCTSMNNYILADVCTGDEEKVWEGRKSFPSGHSSISAYIVVFLACYIQYTIRTVNWRLLKPFAQFLFIMVGLFVGLSRIMDYFHHPTDVLIGFIIGTIGAYYTIFIVMKLPVEEDRISQARSQNTAMDMTLSPEHPSGTLNRSFANPAINDGAQEKNVPV